MLTKALGNQTSTHAPVGPSVKLTVPLPHHPLNWPVPLSPSRPRYQPTQPRLEVERLFRRSGSQTLLCPQPPIRLISTCRDLQFGGPITHGDPGPSWCRVHRGSQDQPGTSDLLAGSQVLRGFHLDGIIPSGNKLDFFIHLFLCEITKDAILCTILRRKKYTHVTSTIGRSVFARPKGLA